MSVADKKKSEFYKATKILGLVSFIPIVLAAGPIAGYFFGEYLEKKIGFAPFISMFFVALGFVAGAREVLKVIRLISRSSEESKR